MDQFFNKIFLYELKFLITFLGKDFTWQKIVKIDSRTRSFCLHQYVQNGLSYSGEETQPTLCLNDAKLRSSVKDLERNKQQLLHRIQSIRTFTNFQ